VADEQERSSCFPCAKVKAAGGGQVKLGWIATQFQDGGRKTAQAGSFFGSPKPILQPVCTHQKQFFRRQAKKLLQARRVGKAAFGEHIRQADPKNRPGGFSALAATRDKCGKSKGKTGHGSAVAGFTSCYFRQSRLQNAIPERGIEMGRTRF